LNDSSDRDHVPNWLRLPPDSAPPVPPVRTKLQVLPFHDLTWENFERLCFRLVELDSDVEYCQIYGTPGQDQDGIDVYARLRRDRTYAVYQCKRLRELSAADVRNAVTKFLKGKWSNDAATFAFCTSHSCADTKIADQIEIQAKRLQKRGVAFELWHSDSLSSRLKELPLLVDDFFGRSFVELFCGADIANLYSTRLDASEIAEYRRKLRTFYHHVFILHDPALPIRGELGLGPIELAERYVLPELNVRVTSPPVTPEGKTRESTRRDVELRLREDAQPILRLPSPRESPSITTRMALDPWLAQSERSIILGGAGSGKSALLRFLVLDLLSDNPVLGRTLARWPVAIPVWVPFPFWTKLIATGSEVDSSLVGCLRSWFLQRDESQLWRLVEHAIHDQRLLLIVDGLDEWISEDAGRIAVQKLQVFVETRGIPAVVVSRPYGYERLGLNNSLWQVSELAPLSTKQKQDVCFKWLSIWYDRRTSVGPQSAAVASEHREAHQETAAFMAELNSSGSLSDLSSVPLLLLLLLGLHIEGAVLPRNRFDAYEYLIEHLVRDHPARKRAAAMISAQPGLLTEGELHNVFAYLALVAQQRFPTGALPEPQIRSALEGFFTNEDTLSMGFTQHEANQHLDHFFKYEEGSVGLLISPIHGQFTFLHRSLQEYLAGTHIARMNFAQQKEIVRSRCADPLWKEAILALLSRTRKPEDVDDLVGSIDLTNQIDPDDFTKRELLAEITFGDFNLTVARSREIAIRICDEIEKNAWNPHRSRLLGQALNGLNSSKTRSLVAEHLKTWSIGSFNGSWALQGMTNWPPSDKTLSILSLALRDEQVYVKRAAAKTLATIFHAFEDTGKVIADLAIKTLDPGSRAAALECLINGWPQHPNLEDALNVARRSDDPTLRTLAIYGRVSLGKHNDEDFTELLEQLTLRGSNRLSVWWRDIVADSLIRGWQNDSRLKRILLNDRPQGGTTWQGLDREKAEGVLVGAFPGDPDVAAVVAELLGLKYGFSHFGSGTWESIAVNFKNDDAVVAAVENWSLRLEAGREREFSLIAPVGRTPILKKKLLDLLDSWVPFWAAGALLEIWGMDDPDVATALLSLVEQAPQRSSEIAQFIPRIIRDPTVARLKLLELVRDPSSRRLDFVIRGFASLAARGDENEIVDACLAAIGDGTRIPFLDMCRSNLILGFPSDLRVREMAKTALASREPPLGAAAQAYADDDEMRIIVGERLTPLPTTLRSQIAEALSRTHETALALSILARWDEESEAETKTLASIGYHTLLLETHADLTEATARLKSCFPCYGPDHEARRQAAFPGLVLLNEFELLHSRLETVGFEGKSIEIPLDQTTSPNPALIDFMGAHWDSIRTNLGPNIASWFTRSEDHTNFWEIMSAAAPRYSALESDFRHALSSNPRLHGTAAGISFLAKTVPKSQVLLQACLSVLKNRGSDWGWFDNVETAAKLIAEHFSHDKEVEDELVEIARDQSLIGPLMTLCLGWPDSPFLDELHVHHTNSNYDSLSETGATFLYYTKSPTIEFQDRLDRDVAAAAANVYHPRAFLDPALARIKRDNVLADRLLEVLLTTSVPNTKASYLALIVRSRGASKDLSEWCRSQLKAHQKHSTPEVGYDVTWPGYRSIVLCIIEVANHLEQWLSSIDQSSE
jgi:hypothetical protein